MNKLIMVTGPNGLMGRHIIQELLKRSDQPILLWIHATDKEEFESKKAVLEGAYGKCRQLEYSWGDLCEASPFHRLSGMTFTHIIHCAAVTRFNVQADLADAVNVRGTYKLCQFANECQALRKLVVLSTIYASGLAEGSVPEAPITLRPNFANHYERSKWEAEASVIEKFPTLPWEIIRMPTAICDDSVGHISQYNAFHNTLKLCYYGLLSLLPGKPETPVYLVSADFVAKALVSQALQGECRRVFHASHNRTHAVSLGGLMDTAFEVFGEDVDFQRRGVIKPVFCDQSAFDTLVEGSRTFSGSIIGEGLESVAPFAPQLYRDKKIENQALRSSWPEYTSEDSEQLVRSACEDLLRTRWGRNVE